jgi:hypothetical protein
MWRVCLLCICLIGSGILPAEAKSKQKRANIVRGDCGKRGCSVVIKELRNSYPDYVKKFEKECPRTSILSLQVGKGERDGQQAWFFCWEAKKQNRTRYGSYLGTLPIPGNEAKFLIPLPSSSPYTQELQTRYPDAIKKAQFQCATKGGNFNILDEQKNNVQLQCYFQAGVQSVDENNDFVSDGEVTRGAGVDEILGTFPVGGK